MKHDNLKAYCQAHGIETIRIDRTGHGEPTVETWNQPLDDSWIVSFVGYISYKTAAMVTEWVNSLTAPVEAFHPDFVPPKRLDDAFDGIEDIGDMAMVDSFERISNDKMLKGVILAEELRQWAVDSPLIDIKPISESPEWTAVKTPYTPANAKLYPHYFMPVGNATHIDLHDICDWLDVPSVIGHAIKKLACAGKRGAKSEKQDLLEAIDCINRRIEVLENCNEQY